MAIIKPETPDEERKVLQRMIDKSVATEAYLRRQYEKRLDSRFEVLQRAQSKKMQDTKTALDGQLSEQAATFAANEVTRNAIVNEKVGKITDLDNAVFSYGYKVQDTSEVEEHDGYISAQNKWAESDTNFHKVISLDGIDKIRVSPQSNTPIIAFLRSYSFEAEEAPDFSTTQGFTKRYVMDGSAHPKKTTEFNIPEDVHYLYFRTLNPDGDQSPKIEFYEKNSMVAFLSDKVSEADSVLFEDGFSVFDLQQIDVVGGYISAENKWKESATVSHRAIVVEPGQTIRVSPKGNTPIIAFLHSYSSEIVDNSNPDFSQVTGYTSRYVMNGSSHPKEPTVFIIPSDVHYLYMRALDGDVVDQSPILEFYERQSVISILEGKIDSSTDSVLNLLDNSRYSDDNDNPFTILQCSDVHGSVDAAQAFKNIIEKYGDRFDVAVNTGDLTRAKWSDGIGFWTSIDGLGGVWNLIGNHDSTINSISVWNDVPIEDVYERFIAPYISNWNVVSAGQNLNYYYKDFAEQGIRLIALDVMYINAAEVSWFENALEGARTADLAVVVLAHYPCGTVNSNTSVTFASIDGANSEQTAPLALNTDCAEKINAFINAGGEFVAWVCGHRHRDDFGYVVDYPDILNITLEKSGGNDGSSASSNYRTHDSARIYGTEGQNSFNLITVDRGKKLVKVVRIGNHCDKYLRQKHSLCYNYETKTVISNN